MNVDIADGFYKRIHDYVEGAPLERGSIRRFVNLAVKDRLERVEDED